MAKPFNVDQAKRKAIRYQQSAISNQPSAISSHTQESTAG
jgi:hypothetical protein